MKNNSLTILQAFSRKLSNCRYKIAPKTLIEYMNDGAFGYVIDKELDKIITNDSVFASEIASAVNCIRGIVKNPRKFLKKEEIVQNAAVVSNFDNLSLRQSLKDEKNWRMGAGGAIQPDLVHSFVHEDDFAIYENKFVTYLIDQLIQVCSKKISVLTEEFTTLNGRMGAQNNQCFAPFAYVDYVEANEGMPLIASSDNVTLNVLSSLTKSKKQLLSLCETDFYKSCKKSGEFNVADIKMTNILLENQNYLACYNFYKNFFLDDFAFPSEGKMYFNFASLNLLKAIVNAGFEIDEASENIDINNSVDLKFNNLIFNKDYFSISVSQVDGGISLTITNILDGNQAKYLFNIISKTQFADVNKGLCFADYVVDECGNKDNEYTLTFVINDIECIQKYNAVFVSPEKSDYDARLVKIIKTLFVVIEGSEFLHTRYCPVCGSKLIAPIGKDFSCTKCNSYYHIFKYSTRDLIWLKALPTSEEELIQETIVDYPIEELAVNEIVGAEEVEPAKETTSTRYVKSFVGKLSQSGDNNIAFYNELKNYILSYKKISSRVSWNYDSFNFGRTQKLKIAVRGKTLSLFLALNPNDYEGTKYYPHDMGDLKKFALTPMMVKVKSQRGVKFAKELIDVALNDTVKKATFEPVNYKFKNMSDKALVKAGLAKLVTVKTKKF